MIENARVLQDDFVPREIVHREAETELLSNALEPIMRDEPAEIAMLSGPTGAGKTCIARYTVDQLREAILDIEHACINCWGHSRFQTFYAILDDVGPTADIHRQSTPTDVLLERLREYDGPPYVVILDEIDQHEDLDILYDLQGITNLELVLIANREEELFAQLDDRTRSRLSGGETIRFDPYSIDELVAILEARAASGLEPGAVHADHFEAIADAAAGDARTAIGILRNAARAARREDREQITSQHISDAVPETQSELRQENLDKLTTDQRVLYEIIEDAGELTPGELIGRYRVAVETPKSDRMVRNYLKKLAHYNLIAAEGKTRDRSYRLLG